MTAGSRWSSKKVDMQLLLQEGGLKKKQIRAAVICRSLCWVSVIVRPSSVGRSILASYSLCTCDVLEGGARCSPEEL